MKRLPLLIAALLLVLVIPTEAQPTTTTVQEPETAFLIGPNVGMDLGDLQEPYVGIDARITSTRIPFVINPTYDYYFIGEQQTFWSLSGNLQYLFGEPTDSYRLYTGAGLGLYRYSSESEDTDQPFREGSTDIGGTLLFGVLLPAATFAPFGEIQYTTIFSNESPTFYELKAGILIRF